LNLPRGGILGAAVAMGGMVVVGAVLQRNCDTPADHRLDEVVRRLDAQDARISGFVAAQRRIAPQPERPRQPAKREPGLPSHPTRDQASREAARIAFIEDSFAGESIDPAWASVVEGQIGQLAAEPRVAGSRITELQCRATLCRMEVEHDGAGEVQRFLDDVVTKIAEAPRATVQRFDEEGGLERSLVFLAKRGHSMPLPPELQRR